MNTLSRNITRRFFRSDEAVLNLHERWKDLLGEDMRRASLARRARKQDSAIDPDSVEPQVLRSCHHMLYAVLRGRDWRRGFSPCTDQHRLDNGYKRWASATAAVLKIHNSRREGELLAPFRDLLSDEALPLIRELIPKGDHWSWQADIDTLPAYVCNAVDGSAGGTERREATEAKASDGRR